MNNDSIKSDAIYIAKAIGILFVVLGHIASPLSAFIFSWHMPLFFFLAGCFLNYDLQKNSYKQLLQKYFKRLFIPFFVFSIIGAIVEFIKNIFLHRMQQSVGEFVYGLLFWMDIPHLHHYGFVL